MNPEEARRVIDQAKYWHYAFDLPWKKTIPTKPGWAQRVKDRRQHFFQPLINQYGGSLKGKTVLDLGCCQGYWSFESKQADADTVLGLDSSESFISEAQAIATILGHDCTFKVTQLEEDLWWEAIPPHDITLMLGVFFHMTDSLYVLRKAMKLTRETIVIDSEVTLGSEPALHLRPRAPSEPTTVRSRPSSGLRTVPTLSALVDVLRDGGFRTIRVMDPQSAPDDYKAAMTASLIASR